MQKYDDMVRFAILPLHFQSNIIIRDVSNNSFVHSAGNCLDVHGLTTKSDQKIFNMLIAHLITSLRLIRTPFNKHKSITVGIEDADKSTTPALIARRLNTTINGRNFRKERIDVLHTQY